MAHSIGDPNHIGVHNTLASDVGDLADQMSVDVALPPQRNLGETGHTDDHNLIQAALDKIAAGAVPGLNPAPIINGQISSLDGPNVVQYVVKDAQGVRKAAYLLPGNTGTARSLALTDEGVSALEARRDLLDALAATDVPEDFEGDPVTLLPKKLRGELTGFVEVRANPQASATYSVTLGAGVFPGVLVGAGGAGGSAGGSYYGGGGGAGAVIGQGANVPVILPVQGTATYTVTVAPTSPGGSSAGVPVLSTGLSTTIAVEGQEPFQVAIGGGRGWSNYGGAGSFPTASGASGGGGFGSTPYGMNNYGLGVPGFGHDGATGPIAGNYGGGGGGYSSPGNARDGGAGFDLATALNLSTTDPNTLALLGLIAQDGFIAGGGTGVNGGTATGGGGQYSGVKDAKDYTGGGGSGHGAATSGSGGAGMALIITDPT